MDIIPNGYLCIYYDEEIILGRDGKPRELNFDIEKILYYAHSLSDLNFTVKYKYFN